MPSGQRKGDAVEDWHGFVLSLRDTVDRLCRWTCATPTVSAAELGTTQLHRLRVAMETGLTRTRQGVPPSYPKGRKAGERPKGWRSGTEAFGTTISYMGPRPLIDGHRWAYRLSAHSLERCLKVKRGPNPARVNCLRLRIRLI